MPMINTFGVIGGDERMKYLSQSIAADSGSLPASTSQSAGGTSQASAPAGQSMSLGEDGAYHPFG